MINSKLFQCLLIGAAVVLLLVLLRWNITPATPVSAPVSLEVIVEPITQSADEPLPSTELVAVEPVTDTTVVARPNIILITIDSLRADHLGSYGNAIVRTPILDALAQLGVRFSFAITPFSQTNPSHASLFTSTYPATHKLKHHGVDKPSESVLTVAEVLTNSGYNTIGVHSWISFEPQFSGLDRGFKVYKGAYFQVPGEEDFGKSHDGRADLTTDTALQTIKESSSSPLFLWVHYQDPHLPYSPPPPFDTMYDEVCQGCPYDSWAPIERVVSGEALSEEEITRMIAHYDGEISFTDQEIGRLLEGIRAANLLDNSIVVVTADHGESFNDNGRWFHPWVLYNSVVRVPLIVSYPEQLPEGIVVDSLVRSTDIMPTILDLAGIPSPEQAEGKSLMPLISGQETGDDRVAFVQVLDDSSIAMVTRRWKLIRKNDTGDLELYDLEADPGETINLASASPQQAWVLEQELIVWMQSHGIYP